MNKQQAPYSLRMPAEMREALETHAKAGRRSLNAELLLRLEASLEDDEVAAEFARLPVIDLPEWPKHPAERRPFGLDGSPIKVDHE